MTSLKPPRISVAIVAHPSRDWMVEELVDGLDTGNRKLTVCRDDYLEGIWQNSRRAWLAYDPDATHHLVLEDDVLPSRDVLAGIEFSLAHLKERDQCIVRFFSDNPYLKTYALGSFIELDTLTAQALVLPTGLIDSFMDWTVVNTADNVWLADARLSLWAHDCRIPVYHTIPSLFEHLCPKASMSVVDRTEFKRRGLDTAKQAAIFWGENRSALEIRWERSTKKAYQRLWMNESYYDRMRPDFVKGE